MKYSFHFAVIYHNGHIKYMTPVPISSNTISNMYAVKKRVAYNLVSNFEIK